MIAGELALAGKTDTDRVRTATIVCAGEAMFAILSRVDYLRVNGSLHATALRILKEVRSQRGMASFPILKNLDFPIHESGFLMKNLDFYNKTQKEPTTR